MWKIFFLLGAFLAGCQGQCILTDQIYVEDAFPSPSPEACMQSCKNKPESECGFWTWNEPGSCSLKPYSPGPLVEGGGPTSRTGRRNDIVSTPGKVYVYRQFLAGSARICGIKCRRNRVCNSFIFNPSTALCTLNRGKPTRLIRIPNSGLQTGKRQCQKCPNNWKSFDSSSKCFFVTTGKAYEGTQISQGCQSERARAVPAKVENDAEQDFVRALRPSFGRSIWIDGNDIKKEGKWVYADGTPRTYFKWDRNNPNNSGGNEDCLAVWKRAGKFNDQKCDDRLNVICTVDEFLW